MTLLVGLCSTYKEGSLAAAAVRSLLTACDHVVVFEGPAGDALDDDRIPETDIGDLERFDGRIHTHVGRWRTDAKKRTAMLRYVQERWQGPVWGVIVDGDEVLMHPEYVRDWLQVLDWHEELTDDPNESYLGRPMRLLELNGQVSWVRGRLLRLDRMIEYKVSTSVFVANVWDAKRKAWTHKTFADGGNVPDTFSAWSTPREQAISEDAMFVMPPLPTEPFIVHRTMLRHPLRGGLNQNRMHHQEAVELERAGMKTT